MGCHSHCHSHTRSFQKNNILNLLAVIAHAAKGIGMQQNGTNGAGHAKKPFAHLHILFRDWNYVTSTENDVYHDLFDEEVAVSEMEVRIV
jgi:hypothetical protein